MKPLQSTIRDTNGTVYAKIPPAIVEILEIRKRNISTCRVSTRGEKIIIELVEHDL